MKISRLDLRGFKRFTETSIQNIPIATKLVMLVGPNGCGKSSLIDAVYTWYSLNWFHRGIWDNTYHFKQIPGATPNQNEAVKVYFHYPQPSDDMQRRKAVYVRTAYRNDPEFQLNTLSRTEPALQEQRVNRLIDNDQTVSKNYHRLVSQGFEDVFERADPNVTIGEFREQLIGEVRDSMQKLFPGLILNSLGNPLDAGTFKFDKGESKSFLYKNLSGGEKAAFDLVLDLLIKRREFDDTVFFVDEPEAHMAPHLQGALVSTLVDLVPDNSQLWLATHSIGMMRKAREISAQNPGSVVFLDFDGVNFDLPQVLSPVAPDRPFWKRAMQVALDDLAGYVTPERVILCEGGRLDGESPATDFDADAYNTIFQAELPHTMFIGAGNSRDIEVDRRALKQTIRSLANGIEVSGLIDRDDRTVDEITRLNGHGVRVLSWRNIESYLLDDEVLRRLCEQSNHPEVANDLIAAKQQAVQASIQRGNAADDLKSAGGDIYNAAKRLIPDRKLGSNARAFQRSLCAPLIVPGTNVYEQLKRDIFG